MTEAQLMADLIQLRRDTAANWTSANTVLSQGEQGYETDTGKMKIGDGSTAWTSLDYFVDSSAYATSSDVATKANTADLATVATSGSYDDLSDQPTIPSITGLATETYVDTAVSNLVDTAPETLDTLNELAAALGDDADFATTTATSIGLKANTADLATVATTGAYSDLTGTPTVPAALTDLSITDGTAGQVLSADGDGTYTFIDAASGGGGGGSFEAVASGSLSDGSTSILNADGTVSAVGEVETPGSLGTNYPSGPDGSGHDKQITMYDSTSGKTVVVVHGGSPSYLGTISLTTFNANGSSSYTAISGPAGFDGASSRYTAMISIGNGKFVLSYYSTANDESSAVVGTISGDTITWGTPYVIVSGLLNYSAFTYYAAEEKVILIADGNFRVGTVSGTDITFGSPTATPYSSNGTLAYFPNRSKAVYIHSGNGAVNILLNTFTLDSSGNITIGSLVLSDSIGMSINAIQNEGSSFYHTGLNKFVFIGHNDSSERIFSVVVDIDEYGQIVVYTPTTIHSGNPRPSYVGAAYDPNINTYVVYWVSSNTDNGPRQVLHIKEATIDSNTYAITTGSLIVSLSDTYYGISPGLYIPEIQKTLMLFGINIGRRAAVWTFTQQVTNLTAENYAGIADAAYADAATATIQTAGSVDDAQSGLTPGQAYYVQGDGTLGLNPGTPSVFAGTAVSATSLLIGKEAPAATVAYADVTGTPTIPSALTDLSITDGTAGQVLSADGDGTYTFIDAASGGGSTATLTIAGGVTQGDIIVYNASSSEYVKAGAVTIPASTTPAAQSTRSTGFTPDFFTGNGLYHTGYDKSFVTSSSQYRWMSYNVDYTLSYSSPASSPNSSNTVRFVFQPANNKIAIIWWDGSAGNMTANVGTVNLSTGVIAWEASNQTISSSSRWASLSTNGSGRPIYISDDDRWIFCYADENDTNKGKMISLAYNSSTDALTVGTPVEFEDSYMFGGGLDFDPNRNAGLVCYAKNSSPYVNYRKWECSNGVITLGSEAAVSGTYNYGNYGAKIPNYPATCIYNPVRQKFLFLYGYLFSDGFNNKRWPTAYNTAEILENGTVSISNAGVNSSGGGNGRNDSTGIWTAFDSLSGTIMSSKPGDSSYPGTLDFEKYTQAADGAVTTSSIRLYSRSERLASNRALEFSPDAGYSALLYYGNNNHYNYSIQNELSTTNINNQVIGVATETIADGASGAISVIGGIDNNQTGLTSNQTYYLVSDGTLSTTADDNNVKYGYSLSTTEIMTKGFS